ncbi:MAG: hypothetical protein JSS49_03800 [Planctomycetes bacterium]|nr:hypothetical protein [Planctomycetota bacterium]
MQTVTEQQNSRPFVDRRSPGAIRDGVPERRQFSASVNTTRPEVAELSEAVDQYKLKHHRRFITFEELYGVLTELGYHK